MPSCANGAPLYSGVDPEPMTNAPPWIQTITGQLPRVCAASGPAGANTLSSRQSSLDGILSVIPLSSAICEVRDCSATGPNAVASRSPRHGAGGSGGRNRSCLLYTSDAADERSSVDLGGR